MSDGGAAEKRPLLRALGWLALLGPFFFASYGLANTLASRRLGVGSIAYGWEHAIPFVPWTIVPYWSIDLFYGLSLLICATRRELDRHAQRLLAAQLISVACFIAFPLRFSFDRPAADGIYGALFTALGSFDKPFNQAPSLHISLLVLIWVRLAAHTRPMWLRVVLHVWMLLVGVSVLTTYQHHFIDIPTGLAVGFAILWALPEGTRSPLAGMSVASDAQRKRLAAIYALGAVVVAIPSLLGGSWLWMFWPAGSLYVVALNYLAIGERGFQKTPRGTMSVGAWGLLAPYFFGAWMNSRIRNAWRPKSGIVADGVSVGRIRGPLDGDRESFAAIVDLSAELPFAVAKGQRYRSIPVLDLTVPPSEKLRDAVAAIEEARAQGPVLVCCAVGLSRSASAVVAWLVATGRAADVDAAIRMVREARPALVVYPGLRSALEELT
ncbi:MAG: phosphatase PAP2/dual specificity phosphatase family protein [Thermoanaerobaculia bacterium]|nr:phosphatase PAP2/dual specificity phosphatase family protein [Thermoanaerobaculia bacterium]